MKALIFDAGPLINFSMNGVLHIFRKLKKEFPGQFLITEDVKKETMDHPEKIKRFELGAIQLQALLKEKIIELPRLTQEQKKEFEKTTREIMNITNSTFKAKGKNLYLIDRGEASCLALSKILEFPNTLVIDERTTRMLCENPENLRRLLEKKLKTSVKANKENYKYLQGFKIIRSTELVFIANKRDLFELKDPRALEAMLYGMKYRGCSISEEEIEKMKNL